MLFSRGMGYEIVNLSCLLSTQARLRHDGLGSYCTYDVPSGKFMEPLLPVCDLLPSSLLDTTLGLSITDQEADNSWSCGKGLL